MFTLNELYGKEPLPATEEARLNRFHFGALVIGEERAKQEAELLERARDDSSLIFGPLVTGTTDAPVAAPTGAITVSSFKDLELAVAEHPDARDALLAQELARKPRPWKAAMKLFLELEKHRTGGPRADVLARLEAALGPRAETAEE